MSESWDGAPGASPQKENTRVGRSVAAGIAAALVGAILWAVIVKITQHELGFAAIGIGFLVGTAMAATASTSPRLPVIGAVLAFLGCLIGNIFVDAYEVSQAFGVSIPRALREIIVDPSFGWTVFKVGFSPIDVLFWLIATYEGYQLTRAAVSRVRARAAAAAAPVPASGPAPAPAPYYPPAGDENQPG